MPANPLHPHPSDSKAEFVLGGNLCLCFNFRGHLYFVCFTKAMSSYNLLKWTETAMHIGLSNFIRPVTIYLFTMLTTRVFCYCSCLHPFSFLFWISLWSVQRELLRKELKFLISAASGLDLGTLRCDL